MKQEKPIMQPYESPENYFRDFNARVMRKIEAEKRVKTEFSFSFRFSYVYAAAVAVLLIVVGVGIYKGRNNTEDPGKKVVENAKKESLSDSMFTKPTIIHEDEVIQQWVEEAEIKPVVAVSETKKSNEELSIEQELEAEGLIVLDVETAWLDDNEILP